MIKIAQYKNKIILINYYNEEYPQDWIGEKLENNEVVSIKKGIFNFEKEDSINIDFSNEEILLQLGIDENRVYQCYAFILADIEGEYFLLRKKVFGINIGVFLSKDFNFDIDSFVAPLTISIFRKIDSLIEHDIFIGGKDVNSITISEYNDLIKNFPSYYEKRLYEENRIYTSIKEYFNPTKDIEKKYNNYLEKKVTRKGENLTKVFKESEYIKYKNILEKLELMLNDQINYSEKQWQLEILQIILLIYPKYISVLEGMRVPLGNGKFKILDLTLLDFNGNIDIIEIKKPTAGDILRKGKYRNNYIPTKELSGSIMQIEKYLYGLNRIGFTGEKDLYKKYKAKLPKHLNINVTSPQGMLIMGREDKLLKEQLNDYEIIKRKYKNILDIISYDDLINRLKAIIEQIKKI